MQNTILDDPVFKLPLIALMMSVGAAELSHRQFNVLSLIIANSFSHDVITPTFISQKAFENHTRYNAEVIQDALAFLIDNRIVERTYPDKSGLPFYAINPDPNVWTIWEDAPVESPPPEEGING